ncbi:MAG: rRNA pseudouridine synthase [Chloroflexi bacterium]|nr:rRNA pseudouridine synthase [Chloroflexota bacterium]
MPTERLQKILAAAGFGSRRACEDIIAAGRVRVNGKRAVVGDKADLTVDKVTLDGDPVAAETLTYIVVNKPRGAVSSLRAQGDRDTVRDLVPVPGRLYPVGRLDAMSEGLVLLTNDGDLTNRLTHPRYGHEKEYRVLVIGRLDQQALQVWRRGVVIQDEEGNSERTGPAKVDVDSAEGDGTWLRVIMREGKKHQIRRVGETLGLRVARIVRIRLGTLRLGTLRPGQWRHLTASEVRLLFTATGAKRQLR